MAKKPTKREEEAPLEALRLLLKTQAMALQPIVHQVSALPIEPELEYYFVPIKFMNQYQAYFRPGKPFKNLKLVNFDKPLFRSLSILSTNIPLNDQPPRLMCSSISKITGMNCSTNRSWSN